MTTMPDTVTDVTSTATLDCFSAELDDAWAAEQPASAGRFVAELGDLRRGQPVVSAAGYEIGLLDGVVVDGELATHLVLQPGHRFGRCDLILPIARVRFDANPLRVVLSRAAIDDLPPVSIERTDPPTLLAVANDRQQRRGIVRVSSAHRRTSIPMAGTVSVPARPALVAV